MTENAQSISRTWRLTTAAVAASLLGSVSVAHADPSKLPPEVGWNYGEQETARSAALAGAGRALGGDVNAIGLNPANMAVSRVYHLAALAQIWPEANRQSYGAAAVDSSTSKVSGGLSGTYTLQDSDGLKRKATDIRFGLAFPVSDKLFFGATAKYLKVYQDGLGPLGQSYASGGLVGDAIVNGFSFDAGLTIKPADILSIGVVGTNLTNPGNGFRPLGLGGGIGLGTQDFSLEGDVVADFTTYDSTKLRYMLGGEYLAGDHFPLRLGYRFDDGQKTHAVGGGVGYLEQSFAVEASMRRVVSGEAATTVVISLQYFLESTGLTKSGGPELE